LSFKNSKLLRSMFSDTSAKTAQERKPMTLIQAFSPDILFQSFQELRKPVNFKGSIQTYALNAFKQILKFTKDFKNGTFEFSKGTEFDIHERGKKRHIVATTVADRVPIHSFCQNVLIPSIRPHLIYDNGASLRGKGTDFSRKRLRVHLWKYYCRYKTNRGYILQGDFSKFFDNIDHQKLIEMLSPILDEGSIKFLCHTLKIFEKSLPCEDYIRYQHQPFSSLNYYQNRITGPFVLKRGVDIGNEISQACGIFFPTRLDNFIKIVKSCKFYGRYMDDFYIIHPDKNFLKDLLNDIVKLSSELGLYLNLKKTHIAPLNKPFTFLKVRYILSPTGKITMSLHKSNFARERIKIKKLNRILSREDLRAQYRSWRGGILREISTKQPTHYHNYKSLQTSDRFFHTLMENKND